jgi:hypothetical protein
MIRVTLEVTNGPTTRRVKVVAPTIERALATYENGTAGPCRARVVFPIDPAGFFVPEETPATVRAPEPVREPLAA